jgi:leucyl-tRNA synthetase
MIDAQYLPIHFTGSGNTYNKDGLPPLGNADVWAWDTATNKVVNTNLVDNKIIFPFRIEYHAWLGGKFVLLDALYGCTK